MPEFRRILCPLDFSDATDPVFSYADTLASAFGSEVHLLHVLQEPVAVLPESGLAIAPPAVNMPDLLDAARQGLDRYDVSAPARVTERVVRHGPAAEEIIAYAGEMQADLIVMGTHGRTGIVHVLLGSIAEKVVRKAPCPVLTVRPHAHP